MKRVLTKSTMLLVNIFYMFPLMTILLFTNQNKEIDRLFEEFKTSIQEV